MDVLLSFVGNQDPISEKTNEEGAILTLCRHIRPKMVYLLPSAEGPGIVSSTEENARMTKEFLCEVLEGCECYVRPLFLKNPTDFDHLIPEVRTQVKKILEELRQTGEEFQLHLNCSSGTPQMKACWYILANSGHLPRAKLWQVYDPTKVSGNRVREISLVFLEEENIIQRLRRCLPEQLFGVMAEECKMLAEISLLSTRRQAAALASRVFLAYALWDLLQYRKACDMLAAAERHWRETIDADELSTVLRAQVDYLRRLAPEQEKETPDNLVDIYYNAERCFARRAYVDTLARFWRLYEGVVYYRLRIRGIEPMNSNGYFLSLTRAIEKLVSEASDKEFLEALRSPVFARRPASKQVIELGQLLEELREKRNSSVTAHGMKPVTEYDAENTLRAGRCLIESLLPEGAKLLEIYPLRPHSIEALVDFLARL